MNVDINLILEKYFTEILFKKGEFLLIAGELEEYIYYLHTGVVRLFYVDNMVNTEITLDFSLEATSFADTNLSKI